MKTSKKLAITITLSVAVAAIVSGCTYTSSWRRMETGAIGASTSGKALVTLTAAQIKPGQRMEFFRQTRRVVADLPNHDGLLGYSFRFEIFGNKAWTMTAWRDASSRDRFAEAQVHQSASETTDTLVERMKFRSVPVEVRALPIKWHDALEILDAAKSYPQRQIHR